jgi:hypothetical protein
MKNEGDRKGKINKLLHQILIKKKGCSYVKKDILL